jgi:very-short-patch-repair endonuclease
LRANLTDAEQRLWARMRRKQILGVQFYRQKPIGDYIADFYAPAVRLIVEVDGSQHAELSQAKYDKRGVFPANRLTSFTFQRSAGLIGARFRHRRDFSDPGETNPP